MAFVHMCVPSALPSLVSACVCLPNYRVSLYLLHSAMEAIRSGINPGVESCPWFVSQRKRSHKQHMHVDTRRRNYDAHMSSASFHGPESTTARVMQSSEVAASRRMRVAITAAGLSLVQVAPPRS